jgi:hypothetical protein
MRSAFSGVSVVESACTPTEEDKQMPQQKSSNQEFSSYEEFFTFYLHEHSDARNRAMHAAGTLLGLCTLIVPFVIGRPWYALLWPVVAYGFAWTGHFLIEGNKPATFGHPFWSFISDFKMLGLMLAGRLKARMQAGATTKNPSSA